MEDIPIGKVLRTRNCVITSGSYPCQSFRDDNASSFLSGLTEAEIKQNVFHGGRLACRVVNILFISKNGKPYSGVVRRLYNKESDSHIPAQSTEEPGLSRSSAVPVQDESYENLPTAYGLSGHGKRRARSPSIEILDMPNKRK